MKAIYFLGLFSILVSSSQSMAQTVNNPFEYYGQRHNEACLYVLRHLNYIPPVEVRKSVVDQLLSNVLTPAECTGYSVPTPATYEQQRASALASCSPALQAQVATIEAFLQPTPTVAEINAFIQAKVNSAASSVPSAELNKYYAYLALIKYSSSLWWPVEKGGQNAIQLFAAPHSETFGGVLNFEWWKFGAIDAIGALGGSLGGPPGAILGGAAASVIYGIGEW